MKKPATFHPKTLLIFLLTFLASLASSVAQEPQKTPSLAERLEAFKSQYNGFLPRMADEETRLDSVEIRDKEFWFHFTFVNTLRSELEIPEFTPALEKATRAEAQRVGRYRDLLIHGATLVYTYKDKDGAHVATVKLTGDQPQPAEKPDLKNLSKDAAEFFEKYFTLERNFDPAVADLYSDDAIIRNKRRYPTGAVRDVTLPAPAYKKLLRSSMPLTKERGDTSSYTELASKEESGGIRITATRYSELKKYSSPISILIARKDGQWLITEELSESRP